MYTFANSQDSSGKYSWYGASVSTKVATAEVGIYEGEISGLSSRIFHTIFSSGEALNDWEPEGKGTLTLSDGRRYVGEWKNGKYHGQGTLSFLNGQKQGQGTYTWSIGREYIGQWKEGKKHGQGTLAWPSGQKYVGELKDDKYHGQGTHTWPDGEVWSGPWKDGKFLGRK